MTVSIANEWRKARKAHRCIWCGEQIEPGERYFHWRGVFEGDIQSNNWHKECDEAVASEDLRDGFEPHAHKRGSQEER